MDKVEEIKEKAVYCLNCKTKPCQSGCPLGNDIPQFIQCIKEGKYEEAYKILSKTTVLESICGRICPHMSQCKGSCIRGIKGKPTSIGDLEAFIGDKAIKENYKLQDEKIVKNNKKVAIVGGGPAGITCSAFLAHKGYDVTIFEKYNELGGILVHGIPDFRLSKDTIELTINKVLNLGIKVEYNKELGKNLFIEELEEKYDAVFLAFGANIPLKMGIEGENLNGVYGGNELLEKNVHPNYENKKVAVIGGGNVAMDCARTIKRLGAKDVYIIYRRAEEQMPADKKEIEEAKKEGIEFLFQNNIIKVVPNSNNEVCKIECVKTKLVQKEGENRLSPVDIQGSNYLIDIDYVVMAIGSQVEKEVINKLNINVNKRGYIEVEENYKTSREKVFAGGDLIGQKATVAWAARAGRDAAEEIDKFLQSK